MFFARTKHDDIFVKDEADITKNKYLDPKNIPEGLSRKSKENFKKQRIIRL